MNVFFATMSRAWVKFAMTLARLRFLSVVFALSLALCFVPKLFSTHSFIENSILYLTERLSGIHERQAEVAFISVEDALYEEWQQDIYAAESLSLLLANVLHSSDARVGLLFDMPLRYRHDRLDELVYQSQLDLGPISQLVRQKLSLDEMLVNPRVVKGYKQGDARLSPLIRLQKETRMSQLMDSARQGNYALSSIFRRFPNTVPHTGNRDGVYKLAATEAGRFHVWFEQQGALSPSYLAALCLAPYQPEIEARSASVIDARVAWPSCTQAGFLPIQPFVAAYDTLSGFRMRSVHLDLDEALALSTFPEWVFVAKKSDINTHRRVAAGLHSLKYDHILIQPWWSDGIVRALFLSFVLYLLFVSSKLSSAPWRVGLLVAVLGSGYAAAVAVAWVYGYLIPLSGWVASSIGIAVLVSIRNIVWRDQRYRRLRLADSIQASAEILESMQAYEETVALLEHHPDRERSAKRIARLCHTLARDPDTLQRAVSILECLHPEIKNHPQLLESLRAIKRDLSRTRTLQAAERKRPVGDEDLPEQLGRYKVERELGRGAVGIVYLGFDPAIARKVAIKTLDSRLFSKDQLDDIKARFFREAEAVGRLNHPNIVSIYDLGEEGDLAYIAMDYVDGAALSEHILAEHLLSVAEVYRIIHDVALGLAYAHEKHIVHRDIKPGNIMYDADTHTVKVADFGIARLLDNSRTTTGEILGSPLYMSPEQLQGAKVGVTADIFSLGVTFYQLLTGELPFDADNLAALTYEIIHSKHKSVRALRKDLPASAARIVNQCLQKAPKNRYQSAQELVSVLRKAIKRDFPELAQSLSLV